MSIPNFKSQHDWEAFTQIFDSQWHCKKVLLDRIKDDLFPGQGKRFHPRRGQEKAEREPVEPIRETRHDPQVRGD